MTRIRGGGEESFRAGLVREIGEELGLRDGVDYIGSTVSPFDIELTAWSVRARAESCYAMELDAVDPTPAARSRIAIDPEDRWRGEAEIRAGRSEDGRPIDATMSRLLDEVRLWRGIGPP